MAIYYTFNGKLQKVEEEERIKDTNFSNVEEVNKYAGITSLPKINTDIQNTLAKVNEAKEASTKYFENVEKPSYKFTPTFKSYNIKDEEEEYKSQVEKYQQSNAIAQETWKNSPDYKNLQQAQNDLAALNYAKRYNEIQQGEQSGISKAFSPLLSGLTSGIATDVFKDENGANIKLPTALDLQAQKAVNESDSKIYQGYSNITQSIGQMIPGIAAGAVNPVLGTTVFASNTFQNARNQALLDGYNEKDATEYGVVNSALETTIGKFLGGTSAIFGKSGLGKAVSEKISTTAASTVTKGILNNPGVKNALADASMEFGEEFLQQWLDPKVQSFVLENKSIAESWESSSILDKENFYAGLLGAITSGVIQAPTNIAIGKQQSSINQRIELLESTDTKNYSTEDKQALQNEIALLKQGNVDEYNAVAQNWSSTGSKPMVVSNYEYLNRTETDNQLVNDFRVSATEQGVQLDNGFMDSVEKIIEDREVAVKFDQSLDNSINGQIQTENGQTTITINPNSQRAGEFIIMHELTHSLETDVMKDLVMDYASKQPSFNEAIESLKQTYGTDDVSDEVLADISGQLFGNQEFINNLSTNNPSIFKKIYDAIISFANKITGNSNQALFIKNLKNKWENAYRTQNNEIEGTKLSQQENIDNQNNPLSKQQQEFFKDSKVRDEKGNLEVVYHGSNNIDFTKFKSGKKGYLGPGIYLTDTRSKAKKYTDYDNIMELYIDVKNPLIVNSNNPAKEILFEIKGNDKTYNNRNGKTSYETEILKKSDIESLKEKGYDGIIWEFGGEKEFMVFNSNQIKNIDNTNPTTNEDIRYSQQDSKWQDFVESNFNQTGTTTQIRLPKKEEPKKILPKKESVKFDETKLSNKSIAAETGDRNVVVASIDQLKDGATKTVKEPEVTKTAKILESIPEKEKVSAVDIKNKVIREVVNKGEAIDRLAKKTGNILLTTKFDNTLQSDAEGMYDVGVSQTNNKGKEIGKSLIQIWLPAIESGQLQQFSDYLIQKHNVDRNAQGKTATGQTTEESQALIKEYEEKYPKFVNWSKDIQTYNKNQLNNMKEAGLISQETQDLLNEMYDNYIRINRDVKGNPSMQLSQTGVKISSPIKSAKGGTQDILPLIDSMARQTLQIKNAIRKNEFGKELYKEIGGEAVQEYSKVVDKNGDNYTFTIFQDGQAVTMDIPKDIYEALAPKPNTDPSILAPIRELSKLQRGLLTDMNPLFIFSNFFKDIHDAPLNSKYSVATFAKNYPRALSMIKNNGELWKLYRALGGEGNTYFDYNTGIKLPSKNKAKKFIEKIQNANKIIEQLPRFTEFISTLEAGGTESEAMYNAAEITTNFKRGGDLTKALNRNGFNFLNASIQGFSKQYRNFTGQNGAKGYISLLSKIAILGVAPAIVNHLMLQDDEDYQALPDYVKDGYYLFKTGDNEFIRIPKGRVMSIFGSAARRTLELPTEEDAFEGLGEFAVNQVAPNNPLEDNIFAPLMAVSTNVAWHGGSIVPTRLQDMPESEQFDESTDAISKFIGQTLNISPKKVNYILDQYTGAIGDIILPMTTPQDEQNPFAAKFTIDSEMSAKYQTDFFTKQEELTKAANSAKATDEDALKSKYFNSTQAQLNDLYGAKREIENSDLPTDEKNAQIREMQNQINGIAKYALEDYDEVYINGNYASVGNMDFKKNNDGEWTKISGDSIEDFESAQQSGFEGNDYYTITNSLSAINSTYNDKNEGITDEDIRSANNEAKKNEITNAIINYNGTDEEKAYVYAKYYSTEENLKTITNAGIDFDQYLKFANQNIEADKNSKGETITNSKKNKTISYINSLDLSVVEKAILIRTEYESFDTYNNQIIDYVNGLNLLYDEKIAILENIGFKIEGGSIKW